MSMNIRITVLNNKEVGIVDDIGKFTMHNNQILWTTINVNATKSRLHKAEQRINRLMSLRRDNEKKQKNS